jgi:hypothetical protein
VPPTRCSLNRSGVFKIASACPEKAQPSRSLNGRGEKRYRCEKRGADFTRARRGRPQNTKHEQCVFCYLRELAHTITSGCDDVPLAAFTLCLTRLCASALIIFICRCAAVSVQPLSRAAPPPTALHVLPVADALLAAYDLSVPTVQCFWCISTRISI